MSDTKRIEQLEKVVAQLMESNEELIETVSQLQAQVTELQLSSSGSGFGIEYDPTDELF